MTTQPGEAGENQNAAGRRRVAGGRGFRRLSWRRHTRKLLAEKRELYDRLLRKQAELENFRKRTQKEKEEIAPVCGGGPDSLPAAHPRRF